MQSMTGGQDRLLLTPRHAPEPYGSVHTRGGDHVSVRRECTPPYSAGVAGEHDLQDAVGDPPQPGGAVVATGGEQGAVR
jgi:hypothetical protein